MRLSSGPVPSRPACDRRRESLPRLGRRSRKRVGGGWWRMVEGKRGINPQRSKGFGKPCMNGLVCVSEAPEQRDRGGHCVGHLVLVPHGATTRRSPHDVEPALRNGSPVVVRRWLVPAQRKARRVEAVQPQEGSPRAGGLGEETRVDRHVGRPTPARRIEQELSQQQARTPPSVGRRTPGCGRRRRRPRGSPTATPCATASRRRGKRRARAYTDGPTRRR